MKAARGCRCCKWHTRKESDRPWQPAAAAGGHCAAVMPPHPPGRQVPRVPAPERSPARLQQSRGERRWQ